jgi:multidrug transporter EmrE-like cation transporter
VPARHVAIERHSIEQNTIIMSYIYVLSTILLTVYGQLIIKWQVAKTSATLGSATPFDTLKTLLTAPWVLSGFGAAFLASLTWMLAMRRLQLSHAYPFMSLNFVLVLLLSAMFFNEPMSRAKVLGVAVIVLGVVIGSRG